MRVVGDFLDQVQGPAEGFFGLVEDFLVRGNVPLTGRRDVDPDEWDEAMRVNVKSVMLMSKYAVPHIKSGALRALAITGATRWFDLPDVPTMRESGYPDLVSETFQGMYAPAGTPADIVQRVARDTLDVLKDPQVLEKLRGIGFDVRADGPAGLAARVAREVPMWRDVIVQSHMELQ